MNINKLTKDECLKQLKHYQNEKKILNRQVRTKREIIVKILHRIKEIDYILTPIPLMSDVEYMKIRDINIVVEFVKQHDNCTSRNIINLLNKKLKNQETRWVGLLDGNRFMSYIGSILENRSICTRIQSTTNKKIYHWSIK